LCFSKTKLPSEIRDDNISDIDNFHIKLNKAVRWELDGRNEKAYFFKTDRGKKKYQIRPNFGNQDIASFSKNEITTAKSVCAKIKEFQYKLSSRMVIGLGSVSVYETSMTLHHIYGVPYIPGQTIKGISRHWFLHEIMNNQLKTVAIKQVVIVEKFFETVSEDKNSANRFDKLAAMTNKNFKINFTIKKKNKEEIVPENDTIKFLKNSQNNCELFQLLFGTQDSAGGVIFFDAFPIGKIKLTTDVMTPHYGDYYGNKKDNNGESTPPSDYLKPNPIHFLTVKDTAFQFVIGVKTKYKDNKNLHEKAQELLKNALKNNGIGAKTAVGYGYFE